MVQMPPHVESIVVKQNGTEVPPAGITLSNTVKTLDLTAQVLPAAAAVQTLSWYSDTPDVVTVNNGKVTAVNIGLTTKTGTIRAFAGGMRTVIKVTVEGIDPGYEPDPFDTVTKWVDPAGFNIEGAGGGDYCTSKADWDVGDHNGYGNVIRLAPDPATGKYYWIPGTNGGTAGGEGGVALTYKAPYTGRYALSMQVWVDTDRTDAAIIWYNCNTWAELDGPGRNVTTKHDWFQRSGNITLIEGQSLGLLAHSWWMDTTGWDGAGLKHSTTYIRDIKLVYLGEYGDSPATTIIDIPSTAPSGSTP
jgi:hypothetical protein